MMDWRWMILAASLTLVAGCNGGGEQAEQPADDSAQQTEQAAGTEQSAGTEQAAGTEQQAADRKPGQGVQRQAREGEGKSPVAAKVKEAMGGEHREAKNRERDPYRHPARTLAFFGLKPDMTVIELYPGGGWYTEVLAPVVGENGKLIVAGFSEDSEVEYYRNSAKAYNEKLAANPEIYGDVEQIVFMPPEQVNLGEADSADMVLTFRNLHNWHEREALGAVFKEVFRVLKPGGVFGVVEHRAPEGVTIDQVSESGYMPEDYVIALAQETGFELEASSDINANPDDTGDHPMGVWTLPPTLRYCEQMQDGAAKASCFEKYRQIGESDRMTLKFVKPATE